MARRCRRAELPLRSGFLSSVSARGGGPRRAGRAQGAGGRRAAAGRAGPRVPGIGGGRGVQRRHLEDSV